MASDVDLTASAIVTILRHPELVHSRDADIRTVFYEPGATITLHVNAKKSPSTPFAHDDIHVFGQGDNVLSAADIVINKLDALADFRKRWEAIDDE